MLSQIRQISDGNHNTVFVKNKEQKFNLDKEIHDLECWKQSRNHIYRKEERELRGHLEKLKHQQEYLHHLDEEKNGHIRGSQTSSPRRNSLPGSIPLTQHGSVFSPLATESIQEMDPHVTPDVQHLSRTSIHTPVEALPPVKSSTDRRALHRTEAHTNICLICQLPKWSHEYPTSEAVCRCKEPEGSKSLMRRFTITGHEGHNYEHIASPIQVGQRRHSLMMARLNNSYGEYKPHPPERGGTGKSQQHDHVHVHHHVHMHHDHGRHHHGQPHHGNHHVNHQEVHVHHPRDDHVNHYTRHVHVGAHDARTTDHQAHYSFNHGSSHQSGNARVHVYPGHRGAAHVTEPHRNRHHGETHTPNNSPRKYSHQSFSQYNPYISKHEPMYAHTTAHQYHGRRQSTAESVGPSVQESDTRTRDHELHWDRHQVCKLKGMITDPHYKEQLEMENGRTYPWSEFYPPNAARVEDIDELKNCRYLRFSKLNLMSMKENPEEEVEVFQKEFPSS